MSQVIIAGDTSGTITLQAPAVSGSSVLTLPATTATLATLTTPSFASTIGVGGATASASGAGISFPATQSASTDANTLDDYEEGTWTPTLTFGGGSTGITYSIRVGTYRKVGSLVVAQFFIVLSNKGSSTGDATVTGFPFTSVNVSNNFCAATFWGSNLSILGMIEGYITFNVSFAQLQQLSTAGANSNLTQTNFANNTEIMMNISYQASA
jgi:hypothetical protein